nr:phosphate/phosphite/phosphonate ABC transporter substrate-binding protein [Halomonas socia]
MFKKIKAITGLFLLSLFLSAPFAHADTIRLAVTDLVGLEELQREFGAFRDKLSEVTGYDIEFTPVTNRTAAVEALRFEQVDFVLTGPAEYVVMQNRADAKLVVGFSRPDYFAVVVTMAESGYNSVEDLVGERVAMGSAGSTSRHLGPIQVLADAGVAPMEDMEIVNTTVPVLWESLKRGDAAAVGMNNTNFIQLRREEMENGGLQPGAFRVIARGPDLPNDLLMAGSHVSGETIARLRDGFVNHSDELIDAIVQGGGHDVEKYTGMRFIANINDSDYNYVRSMYATIGYPEYSDFVGD